MACHWWYMTNTSVSSSARPTRSQAFSLTSCPTTESEARSQFQFSGILVVPIYRAIHHELSQFLFPQNLSVLEYLFHRIWIAISFYCFLLHKRIFILLG